MMQVYQARVGLNDTYVFKHMGYSNRVPEFGVPRGGDFITFTPKDEDAFPDGKALAVVANVIWPQGNSPWIVIGDIIGGLSPVDEEGTGSFDMTIVPIEVRPGAGTTAPEVVGGQC